MMRPGTFRVVSIKYGTPSYVRGIYVRRGNARRQAALLAFDTGRCLIVQEVQAGEWVTVDTFDTDLGGSQ